MLGRSAENAVVIPVFDGELKLRLVKPLGKVTEACRKARPEPRPCVAKLLQRSACSQSCRIWKRRRGLEKSKPKGHFFWYVAGLPLWFGQVEERSRLALAAGTYWSMQTYAD